MKSSEHCVFMSHERPECCVLSAYGCGVLFTLPVTRVEIAICVGDISSNNHDKCQSCRATILTRMMKNSCAKTHLAAHLLQVSLSFKNVHLEVVGAAAAAAANAIQIPVRNAVCTACEE